MFYVMASWIVYLLFAERHIAIGIDICAICPIRADILAIFIPCERKEELG
jgi:hypothetical protein